MLRLVESRKQLSAADTDDTDTVEAFVALGGKVSSKLTPVFSEASSRPEHNAFNGLQADRSGKVLVEKLRNTIKVWPIQAPST